MRLLLAPFLILLASAVARANDVTGSVVSPTGEAVSGAEVIVSTPNRAAWPNVPLAERRKDQRGAATTTTDAQGRFTINLPADAGLLCVHHPKTGYAEVKPAALSDNPQVKLNPWCRVEGVFRIGTKTVPQGTKVQLGTFGWSYNAARVHYRCVATTDAEGRYVLDRVPAGLVKIETQVSPTSAPLGQYTTAAPDKPTRFDIGGTGRPVIGKLVLPASIDLKRLNKWPGFDSQCYFRRDVPWARAPTKAKTFPIRRGKTRSANGATRRKRSRRTRPSTAARSTRNPTAPSASMTSPRGKYVLSISFHSLVANEDSQELAEKKIEVVVPDAPAPTDEPLDLGDIELGKEGL